MSVLICKANDFTVGRQIAFYTPLLQFGKVSLCANAVFLVNFGKFLALFLDGFLFLPLGATFFKGIELLLQPLLVVANGLL